MSSANLFPILNSGAAIKRAATRLLRTYRQKNILSLLRMVRDLGGATNCRPFCQCDAVGAGIDVRGVPEAHIPTFRENQRILGI